MYLELVKKFESVLCAAFKPIIVFSLAPAERLVILDKSGDRNHMESGTLDHRDDWVSLFCLLFGKLFVTYLLLPTLCLLAVLLSRDALLTTGYLANILSGTSARLGENFAIRPQR